MLPARSFSHPNVVFVDLRALACDLVMRGEVDGSLKLIECLREINGLSTAVGQCLVRGMIKKGHDVRSLLAVISDFHDQVQVSMQ